MNSLFLRFYAAVVLSLMLIALLAYAGIVSLTSWRADYYRESMARGSFYLMAEGLARQQGEEARKNWLEVLTKLMGSEVQLIDWKDLDATASEKEKLHDQRVVMRISVDEGYGDIYFPLPDKSALLYVRMTKVNEQQARASALLVLDELSQFPQQQWSEELQRISEYFAYPLRRIETSKLSLDRSQLQRLERREVVVVLDDSGSSRSGVSIYAPIGDTGEVLKMGPLILFDHYPVEQFIFVGLLGLMSMGGVVYLLVRPLQTRLHRLGESVAQLGSGNLDVHADVDNEDAIGRLAATFNGMTAQIKRLIESQREMVRAVSHELRTPVARLRFGMEIMADMDDARARGQKLEALDKDIEQLDELIDEILTYARLEEGAPELEKEPVNMLALLQRLCDELQPLCGDILLSVDPSSEAMPDDLKIAYGSERYLHRVVQNLATNALRYANSRVLLRYRVEDEQAIVEVDDDGPGIPEQERERVFKPFARLDESRQRKSGGYGLGLSIVHRISEWHNGNVSVSQSRLGGAQFVMRWPRRPSIVGLASV